VVVVLMGSMRKVGLASKTFWGMGMDVDRMMVLERVVSGHRSRKESTIVVEDWLVDGTLLLPLTLFCVNFFSPLSL
jgi:hypothetical protein